MKPVRNIRTITATLSIMGCLISSVAQAQEGVEAVFGALIGAGSGALLGQAVGGRDGAVVGGALGAMVGTVAATRPVQPVHYVSSAPPGWYPPPPMYAPPPLYRVAAYPAPIYPPPPVVVYRTRPFCPDEWHRIYGPPQYRSYRRYEEWGGYEPRYRGRW